ncbi:MAG: hypothetical protein QM817_31600 [Archangium sp.]
MSNLRAAVVGETVVLVTNATNPEQEEWDAYLVKLGEHLNARAGKPGRLIVFAGGGTPSSSMRLGLRNVVKERPLQTAVISDSAVVRGIIGVFALFVKGTKPYGVRDWKAALEYVGFPYDKLNDLVNEVKAMDSQIGGCVAVADLVKTK